MALVAHTIRSKDRPVIALNDNKAELVELEEELDDEWEQPIAGPSRLPPRFIRATVSNVSNEESESHNTTAQGRHTSLSEDNTSTWYHQLTTNSKRVHSKPPNLPETSSSSTIHPPVSTALEVSRQLSLSKVGGDWFSLPRRPTRFDREGVDSIAEQLDREPPSESSKRLPVWIALQPSNRGYQMVSRSGWNEGEGLGARQFVEAGSNQLWSTNPNLSRISNGKEVIDLTDLDSEDEFNDPTPSPATIVPVSKNHTSQSVLPSGGVALLTPIPTTLKSDRLGIGLNPKYITDTAAGIRIPKRRVTHGQQALLEHAKSVEQTRKLQQQWGRGKRGHSRRQKVDADTRRRMLAYMNS